MAYQEVHIADLQPGSYVVQVLQQTGDVIVKHAGWVRTSAAIEQLRRKGVQVVLTDPDKKLEETKTPSISETISHDDEQTTRALFSDEWPKAERALAQTQKVQRQMLDAVRHHNMIDLTLVHEVSAGLADSISRNQDVLLCLNRIAEQSDSLLQHSISCAVYMAAFARHLNMPAHKVQSLITAALLHDIGKALNPDYLLAEDYVAIPASLNALQQIQLLQRLMPALKALSEGRFKPFEQLLHALLSAIPQPTLAPWLVSQFVEHNLAVQFDPTQISKKYSAKTLAQLTPAVGQLLALVSSVAGDKNQQQQAWQAGIAALGGNLHTHLPAVNLSALSQQLPVLLALAPLQKQRLWQAIECCVKADQLLQTNEQALLLALALLLEMPYPGSEQPA